MQYHIMVFGSGILGLIYVSISYGFNPHSLKGLVMALAYCWGLVLAIYLMGHGLVAIPRRLIRNASISGRLRRIQTQAPKVYEKMEDAEMSLEDLEMQVSELSRRKVGTARDFQDWIEELVDVTNQPESQPRPAAVRGSGVAEDRSVPHVITEKYLADLTRNLVRARHARSRWVDEWNRLLQDAAETQAVLDSAGSKKLEFGRVSPQSGFWDRHTVLTPYTRYLYYYHFMPYAKFFLGVFLGLASACIVWSEMVKVALPKLSVVSITVVHHWSGDKAQVGFAGQLIAFLWLLYMCTAALTSITEVKVWRGRALVKRNTAHESAFWYASQVARLSIPLSYNFLTFVSPVIYRKTVFFEFLGKLISLTPLGEWFDYLFPMFILIPVCATLFGLYGKVRNLFGFGVDLVDDETEDDAGFGTGSWREGRDLIERELHGTSFRHRLAENAAAGGRAAPVRTVPGGGRRGAGQGSATTPFATSPSNTIASATAGSSRRALGQPSRAAGALPDEHEDDNFFSTLGHRMKNTIDTLDTPRWLQDIGQGIKKPKWMGGDEDAAARPSGAFGRTDSGDGIRRWFGGGSGEGRLRL